jgi:hypothetical protein
MRTTFAEIYESWTKWLAVLGIAAGDTQLPPAFFVKSALFVLCAAFGVTFFALDWYAARGDREAAAP